MGDKRTYVVICLLLISGMLNNYFSVRGSRTTTGEPPGVAITIPFDKAGWRGAPYSSPVVVIGNNEISREYRFNNGMAMNFLFLIRKNEPHDPRICYGGLGWQLTDAPRLSTSSGRVVMAGLRGLMKGKEILVYYGYHFGTRVIPDGIERKYHEVRQRLVYGQDIPVFVEVTAVVPQGEIKQAESYLRKFLEDMEEDLLTSKS